MPRDPKTGRYTRTDTHRPVVTNMDGEALETEPTEKADERRALVAIVALVAAFWPCVGLLAWVLS